MKNFMMIFYGADYAEANLSPEEAQIQMGRWFDWVAKLQEKGLYKGGEALTTNGKTISGKDKLITDGPFAEAKEMIGGYFLILANSLEEAFSLTEDYPDFQLGGSVEVREVMVFEQ